MTSSNAIDASAHGVRVLTASSTFLALMLTLFRLLIGASADAEEEDECNETMLVETLFDRFRLSSTFHCVQMRRDITIHAEVRHTQSLFIISDQTLKTPIFTSSRLQIIVQTRENTGEISPPRCSEWHCRRLAFIFPPNSLL